MRTLERNHFKLFLMDFLRPRLQQQHKWIVNIFQMLLNTNIEQN